MSTIKDVEVENILSVYSNDPHGLQLYIQKEQANIFKNITAQKDLRFEKVYGDLSNSTSTENDKIQHKEMSELNKNIYETQKRHADLVTHDKDLASRKYEMNEWTVNNKRDTLFIFSMLFIMLSGLLFITGLWKLGLISISIYLLLGIPMLIIFILTIVYRSQYTNIFRNKRYWNKKSFEGKYGKIQIPLVCPGTIDNIQRGLDSINSNIRSGVSSAALGAAQTTQNLAQDVSDAAQQVAVSAR